MNSTGWDEIKLISLAQDTESSRDFLNTLMNFGVPKIFGIT
jgi:hypothetical protein